ncbi:MAG TPA: hypothetical protein VF530_15180 [Planctomycetota bacterium]
MKPHLFAALLLALPTASAQVTLFEGRPGEVGDVVVRAGMLHRPPELQGVVLLPLECVGRTRLTELLDGHTRRRTDVPGAARLLLPDQRGSLYKYRRDAAGGGASFGFFLVRAGGTVTPLFELPGTGTSGAVDPFPGHLACAGDGRAFLVASAPAAGGDLWEIELVGRATNRTAHLGPLEFGQNGLALLGVWGLGVGADGVYRFERASGGLAHEVDLPLDADWFGSDVVASADESTVAFVAGIEPTRARVLTCRRFGDAVLASDRSMHVSGGGFLPEDRTGPALALSTDGSWVAWRAQGTYSREVFVRETRSGSRPPREQLTSDANFYYTLNDTGVIAFFDRDSAVLFVGRGQGGDIGIGDLFTVDLSASAAPAFANLTGTSGDVVVPFDYGTLNTADGLFQVPGSSPSFLVHDRDGQGRLLWTTAQGSAHSILDGVSALDTLDTCGAYLVAGVTRPPGAGDPLLQTLGLLQVPPGGLGAVFVRLPDGCHLDRTVAARSHDVFAAVLSFPGGERMGRLQVPGTGTLQASPGLLTFGPTAGLSSQGAVLATVEIAREHATFAWSDLGASVLDVTRAESFLLPGL